LNLYRLENYQRPQRSLSVSRFPTIGYDGLATVQTETVKRGVYGLSIALMGVLFIVVALVIQFAYPLNKKTIEENASEPVKHRKDEYKEN
jgi:GPH family glycoside/pentoside/hexuronide:cation symporter